jgi:flagellar capping protein FliD
VTALFASIGDKLAKAAEVFGKPAIGTIALKVNATTESIATLNRRADEVQLRLDDQLERMTCEWVWMEEAMSRLQAQGSWLSSQISSLPGYY